MSSIISLAIMLVVVYIAITRVFPEDNAIHKAAVAAGGAVAVFFEQIWDKIGPMIGIG